jgi:hypothetical protein
MVEREGKATRVNYIQGDRFILYQPIETVFVDISIS